jgi:hypothetical protein
MLICFDFDKTFIKGHSHNFLAMSFLAAFSRDDGVIVNGVLPIIETR